MFQKDLDAHAILLYLGPKLWQENKKRVNADSN